MFYINPLLTKMDRKVMQEKDKDATITKQAQVLTNQNTEV